MKIVRSEDQESSSIALSNRPLSKDAKFAGDWLRNTRGRTDGHQPSSQKWVSQHLSLRITRVRPSLLPFNTLNIKDFWSTSQQALLGITVCFEFNKTAVLLRWMTVSKNVFIPPFVFPSIKVTAFETRGIAYFLLQSCLFHEKQWFLAILDQILHLWWKEFGGNSFIKNAEYDQKC